MTRKLSAKVEKIERKLLGEGVIEFGRNSFRGDIFESGLRKAIEQWEEARANVHARISR